MRTLKKTLALVLVLALALSVSVIGASAFTDVTADTEYAEAIDVMTGIGVINGMPDGTFAPDGSLTREQAAKIISYMLLGPVNVELISSATTQVFDDVATTRWSAGYIEYCANLGIIVGMGDGTFDPEGTLTSAAFTKMLLCALGYDAGIEGFTGSSWAIKVASIAVTAGVSDSSIAISAVTVITRAEACQLAFLALQARMVEYVGGTEFTIGDTTIIQGATRQYVTVEVIPEIAVLSEIFYVHFMDQYFPTLSYESVLASANYGVKGHMWTSGSPAVMIAGIYADEAPVAVYAGGTTAATIQEDYAEEDCTTVIEFWRNGDQKASASYSAITDVPYGATVALYANADGEIYKVLATCEYLAEVTTVTEGTVEDTVVFTVYDTTGGYTVTLTVATGTYAEGDLFIVVPFGDNSAADEFLSMTAPGTVEGMITSAGSTYFRIDGVKTCYGISPMAFDEPDFNTSTFVFYLGTDGSIVGFAKKSTVVAETGFDGYLYVLDSEGQVEGSSSSLFGDTAFSASAKASVLIAGSATAQTIDLAVYLDTDTDTAYAGIDADGVAFTDGATPFADGWYGYTMDDGYVLTAMADDPAGLAVDLLAGDAEVISGKYADSSTVVSIYNYDATTESTSVVSYTGIAGYPAVVDSYDASYTIVVTYDADNASLVETIDIFGADASATTTTLNYAYYVGAGEMYAVDEYFQGFYVGGEYVEYKLSGEVTLAAGDVYDITLDTEGELSAASPVEMDYGTVSYVGSTYTVIDDAVYYYATGFATYDVTSTGDGSAVALAVDDIVMFDTNADGDIAIAYLIDELPVEPPV